MNQLKQHRGTIAVEDCEIISNTAYPGKQYVLRVHAPQIAKDALPGSFAHIQCSPWIPLRRPISIMRTNANTGHVDFLYKVLGEGTKALSERKTGETVSLLGPIGKPFTLNPKHPRPLLIGGGVGMPPMIFIASEIFRLKQNYKPFVILGSEVPFPFTASPSKIVIPGMPDGVIASMPLMEDCNIPSRLASLQGYAGCFDGYVTDLARHWLSALSPTQLNEVEVFTCGPHAMIEAVVKLAKEYNLPCQVSLEEFMACAVGGCAGCVVKVQTPNGPAMKRVCVDGPVFNGYDVFAV
jgi:dihydroorotate dehydrogenase electron transfer subunit